MNKIKMASGVCYFLFLRVVRYVLYSTTKVYTQNSMHHIKGEIGKGMETIGMGSCVFGP